MRYGRKVLEEPGAQLSRICLTSSSGGAQAAHDVKNETPILEYSPPESVEVRGLASIWIAVAVFAFTAAVLVWDDPFQSMGNEKPVRVSFFAGTLGVLIAIRDLSKAKTSTLPLVGLLLNVLAILAASVLLPYI
jgi:hypothetical protein